MTKTQPKALSNATTMLFHVAARSHTLCQIFGLDVKFCTCGECGDCKNDTPKISLRTINRPWLTAHPTKPNELTFDPDILAKRIDTCSEGEGNMIAFILNVWNPSYARDKGWKFDMFRALNCLDQGNREAIAYWLNNPIWP